MQGVTRLCVHGVDGTDGLAERDDHPDGRLVLEQLIALVEAGRGCRRQGVDSNRSGSVTARTGQSDGVGLVVGFGVGLQAPVNRLPVFL